MDKLTQKEINDAISYIEYKASIAKQRNGKFKLLQERRTAKKILTRLTKQKNWLIKEIEKLSFFENNKGVRRLERKDAQDEIKQFVIDLPEVTGIADEIVNGARPSYKRGAKEAHTELKMSGTISFELINEPAIQYLNGIKDLNLSDRKGSITRETRKRIIKILTDAAESGQSYTETAKEIMAQGESGVFSQARAELIATNQIGQAYGEGNKEMVDIFQKATGAIVQKYWITVRDDRVTEECAANEDMGWIENNEVFKSGDLVAPRSTNPRCRCDTGYRQVDSEGNPI